MAAQLIQCPLSTRCGHSVLIWRQPSEPSHHLFWEASLEAAQFDGGIGIKPSGAG
jgi:hypothetical protein